MRNIFQKYKTVYVGLGIFILALLPRLFLLNLIPIGIEDDNLNYVLNAKAVFLTGHDISGTWNPLSLQTLPGEHPQSEIPYLLLAPLIGVFTLTLFFAYLPYVLVSAALCVILYLLAKEYFDQRTSLIIGLVAIINPWGIFFGRSAFEAPLALFFYLLGWYFTIKLTGWKKLFAILPLFCGFYTYMAYKLLLLPFIGAIILYTNTLPSQKTYRKPLLGLGALAVILFVFFLATVTFQPTSSRVSELSLGNKEQISKEVIHQRQMAVQNPFSPLFSNKLFVRIYSVSQRYVQAFSPNLLFVQTEATPRFMIYQHGYFYLIDTVFLILGLCTIYLKSKKLFSLLVFLIAIAPIPSVLSTIDLSFSMRSSLYIPLYIMLIGAGLSSLFTYLKTLKIQLALGMIILGVYGVFFLQFLYTYLFIQPVYASPAVFLSGRIVANYTNHLKGKPVVVVTEQPREFFKQYVFYIGDYSSRQEAEKLQPNFRDKKYTIENIQFLTCKQLTSVRSDTTYIFSSDDACPLLSPIPSPTSIARLSDGGKIFSIAQDQLCAQYSLKRYPSDLQLADFSIESLSPKRFCETFITKLD